MDRPPTKPEDAAQLLKEAEVLYERHQAGRRDPFNVFTALRSPSDEVNLHSRFLHALLDHWDPNEKQRANLDDFTKEFWPHTPGFAPDGAKVERERHNIDILITNDSRQALAIENKIYADDQDRQIEKYYKELKERYKDVHVLYLTIDGHDPSERSTGDHDEEKYSTIAYGKILDWLELCQKRAYDEPELRESVAQYLHLIRKMTGNDRGREYMGELKKLLLQGNNLIIARDLGDAVVGARVGAMHHVWREIERELEKNSNLFEGREEPSGICENRIKAAVAPGYGESRKRGWFGIYYSFSPEYQYARLGVEANVDEGFMVGVHCDKKEYKNQYGEIVEKFKSMDHGKSTGNFWWPWFHVVRKSGTGLKLDDPDDLAALLKLSDTTDPTDLRKLAGDICRELKKIREKFGPTS